MALDPRQVELAVLHEAVELHPRQLTPVELVSRLAGERDEGAALTAAIDALKESGLLEDVEGVVAPTDAALRATDLLTL